MYLYHVHVCDRTEQKQRGGRKPERKVRNLQDPFMLQSAHFRSELTPTYLVAFARHGHMCMHIREDCTIDQTVTEKTGPGIFAIKSELIEQHR